MKHQSLLRFFTIALLFVMISSACGTPVTPTATEAPDATNPPAATEAPTTGGLQIPEIVDGKFNIAMVLIGPHDDGGWSQAHYEGLQYIEKNMPDAHIAYIENVPEGADSEQVFRSLARKGFNLIFGTSFGYMDPMETVAGEFPDSMFVHISGYKTNGTNFGNLFGAMEDMKYLAGMVAGSRAKMDGKMKLGYMATFPIPEELRLGNAFMLGALKTCPECTMDVRWINTWHDPVAEKDAAASLFDAGAQVVLTGADTPAVADVAQEKSTWGITYDYIGSCKVDRCLTTIYWNWGPIYTKIAKDVQAKTYVPGFEYFEADSGSLGLYGFMEGQSLTKGAAELPAADIQMVRDTLALMLAGKFTRFDVFAGPIKDNKGNVVLAAGEKMAPEDIDCFAVGTDARCKVGMYWWASGVTAELPSLSQ